MGITLRQLPNTFVSFSKWMTVPLSACILISCNMNSQPMVKPVPATLPYKVDGASDLHRLSMQERLEKQGVKIVTIGQNYLVSIPSSAVFAAQSPRIKWGCYGVLNDVACYLKQFRKVAVSVSSFTGKCVSPPRDRALTLARSRAVADYLWSQDIDSRFIFTHGLGADKPIGAFASKGDNTANSRIEITFRDDVA